MSRKNKRGNRNKPLTWRQARNIAIRYLEKIGDYVIVNYDDGSVTRNRQRRGWLVKVIDTRVGIKIIVVPN